jgi:ABC-2 type transport system permease protein
MHRLAALIRKEITQLLRDRRGLVLILALPLAQLFLYAYAANTTVYHIPLAVVDQSRDRKSREFVQALVTSQYFNATQYLQTQAQAVAALDDGQVRAALVIPPGFAAQTDRGTASALLLLDGSDSSSASAGAGAAAIVAQNYALQLVSEQLSRKGLTSVSFSARGSLLPITAATRVLYNPDMIDIWFLLPGLVGLLLQSLAIQESALIMVRERETGTMEQILVTPARPLEVVLSKMLPLLVMCLLAMAVILAIGVFWFGVPFQGSLLLYFALAALFIVSSLGLGLLVSNRASNQREASQSALIFMLFGMLLSGWIYPQSAMPPVPRFLGNLIPMSYFLRISRGIFTKGVGLTFVATDALALLIYSLVILLIASRNFKTRLD